MTAKALPRWSQRLAGGGRNARFYLFSETFGKISETETVFEDTFKTLSRPIPDAHIHYAKTVKHNH